MAATKNEELVEIELMKDNDRYKDDVFVAVNGKSLLIKRGERVKIPKEFAEALENSAKQRRTAYRLISKLRED